MTDGGQIHAGTVRVWLCLLCGSKTIEKGKGNSPAVRLTQCSLISSL